MNLEIFLTFIATPFLAIITGVFIYVAHKANKLQSGAEIHEMQEAERFEYKEKSLSKIDNKIDDLTKKVAIDLLEPINQVYQKINLIGLPANLQNLEKCLNDIEVNPHQLTDDSYWFGLNVENIKITFIAFLNKKLDKLIITSFSHSVTVISEELLSKILEYNKSSLIGNVGINKTKDTNLIIVDYVMFLHDNHLPLKAINEIIKSLCNVHVELFAEKYLEIGLSEFIIDDYVKLVLGEKKYNELESGSPKEIDSKTE